MIRNKFFLTIFLAIFSIGVCLNFCSLAISAEDLIEEDDIENIKLAENDFTIDVVAVGQENDRRIIVDRKTIFLITRIDNPQAVKSYKLFYFLDDRLDGYQENISLPFEFNQTYRGILNGPHKVRFVLQDNSGKTSSLALSVYVKHTKKKR